MAQGVGSEPLRESRGAGGRPQAAPQVSQPDRPARRRHEHECFGVTRPRLEELCVLVGHEPGEWHKAGPVRLAVCLYEPATDLHQPALDDKLAEIVPVSTSEGERLVRAQSAVGQDENEDPVSSSASDSPAPAALSQVAWFGKLPDRWR